ncbi:hypothetical protein OEZ85_014043 [Tetradesmus obliquus]|uniref:Ig-like domain-containing protein n=1 Tax=Tetradesmus obliquus TaxID=3088 RepID=A0ABY8U7A3_TETOB|nr:hypothetical protein OEZ85_014043 [Tetradesmus obliquus]
MARATVLVTVLLAWLLACCNCPAAATRTPGTIHARDGPAAAVQLAAGMALQGDTPDPRRSASSSTSCQFKTDNWRIHLLDPSASTDPSDPVDGWLESHSSSTSGPGGYCSTIIDSNNGLLGDRQWTFAAVGGPYLNSTGQAIGRWYCNYVGGNPLWQQPGDATAPNIGVKMTGYAIALSAPITLTCIAWAGYDPDNPTQRLPCGPGRLVPGGKVQCAAKNSSGPPSDTWSKCQLTDSTSRTSTDTKGGACLADEAASTPMLLVNCGQRYELIATDLLKYSTTIAYKKKPGPAAAVRLAAGRAAQRDMPPHPRSASSSTPCQLKNDQWAVNLYNPGASSDSTDPSSVLSVFGYMLGGSTSALGPGGSCIVDNVRHREWSQAGVSGTYLNSSGQAIGTWECSYTGGIALWDPPATAPAPTIDVKITANAITLASSITFSCTVSASSPDNTEPLPCTAQLVPGGRMQCTASPGPATNYWQKCHVYYSTTNCPVNCKNTYDVKMGGCLADKAASTAMMVVQCG